DPHDRELSGQQVIEREGIEIGQCGEVHDGEVPGPRSRYDRSRHGAAGRYEHLGAGGQGSAVLLDETGSAGEHRGHPDLHRAACTASRTSAEATTQPIFHPVVFQDLPAEETVTTREVSSRATAGGTCAWSVRTSCS